MRKMSDNLLGLLVSVAVVVGAPLVGLTFTVLSLRRSFGDVAGESVDPSQKARILAEGISEGMNGTALGLVASTIALVPTVIFAVRLHRESKRARD